MGSKESIDLLVGHLTPKIVKFRLGHIRRHLQCGPSMTSLPVRTVPSEIADEHVEKLVKRCSNLKVLDLSGSPRLTNNSLRSIIRYLNSTLEELGVADTQIEVDDLFESKALPKLKRLY